MIYRKKKPHHNKKILIKTEMLGLYRKSFQWAQDHKVQHLLRIEIDGMTVIGPANINININEGSLKN